MTNAQPSRADARRRLRAVLALTSTFLVAEAVGGWWTGSLALLADAGHMLTDVGGLALALMAMSFAQRPATPQRTFGYHRVEILSAFANGVILLAISFGILYEAYERLRNPPPVASGAMLLIGALGLVVNVAGVLLIRSDASDSLNVKGAYFELISDLLSSIGVIVASLAMITAGWYWADPLVSAGIGLFILPRTWRLLAEALGVLLEGAPPGIDVEALRKDLESVPGVVKVHDFHVWTITSGMYSASAHAILGPGAQPGEVREELRRRAANHKVAHATFQVEEEGAVEAELHE